MNEWELRVLLFCLQKCIFNWCGLFTGSVSAHTAWTVDIGHCAQQLAGIEQQEHREPDITGGGALAPE